MTFSCLALIVCCSKVNPLLVKPFAAVAHPYLTAENQQDEAP
jgi:hypothetical protein